MILIYKYVQIFNMKMDQSIMDKWTSMNKEKVTVFMFGTIIATKGIGKMIKQMDMGFIRVVEVNIMMDNGKMIKNVDMGYVNIWTVEDTRENGKMIFRMDTELRYREMEVFIPETSWVALNTVKAPWSGPMDDNIKVNGKITSYVEKAHVPGQMANYTKVNG